jgi:SAM-dependent methyltransferase
MTSVEDYFSNTFAWNSKFLNRFSVPLLRNARVLDYGAGVGSLSIGLAQAGSRHVVGFDPDAERIGVARRMLRERFPEFAAQVEFVTDLDAARDDEKFDYIFSRDTFEHIHDLAAALATIRSRLRAGGAVYAGFGPLYRSPFGDHGLLGYRWPWAHLLNQKLLSPELPGELEPKERFTASELNRFALADYLRVFGASGLIVESIDFNVSDRVLMKALKLARRLPGFAEFCTCSIYVVLRKPCH